MNNIPEIDLPVYEKMARVEEAYYGFDERRVTTYIKQEILLSDVLNYLDNKEDGYEFTAVVGMWNYPIPYYSQQSEETKAFIRSLI